MKTPHPIRHPLEPTFGLTERECADIRLAAESPLWRYILLGWSSSLMSGPFILVILMTGAFASGYHGGHHSTLLFGLSGLAVDWIFLLGLGWLAVRTYDWFCRRKLGRMLGYRRHQSSTENPAG